MDVMVVLGGMIIGSFLNVCIYRIPLGSSLFWPPSACCKCGHRLTWWANVPLLSFLTLRGRCYYCCSPISLRYPLVELLAGILAWTTFAKFGLGIEFAFYLLLIYFLLVIAFVDLATQLIHNRVLLVLLITGLIMNAVWEIHSWEHALLGMFSGGAIMLAIAMGGKAAFGKDALGMGDVKLMAVAGFFLGWQAILMAIFMGFLLALAVIVGLQPFRQLKFGQYIPLGPFLATALVILIFYGSQLLNWYITLII